MIQAIPSLCVECGQEFRQPRQNGSTIFLCTSCAQKEETLPMYMVTDHPCGRHTRLSECEGTPCEQCRDAREGRRRIGRRRKGLAKQHELTVEAYGEMLAMQGVRSAECLRPR